MPMLCQTLSGSDKKILALCLWNDIIFSLLVNCILDFFIMLYVVVCPMLFVFAPLTLPSIQRGRWSLDFEQNLA